MITAECHSDDHVREATFDATPWFEQASDGELVSLAECGWRGDYPADAVAQFMAEQSEPVRQVFEYIELVGDQGFECSVNTGDGETWLREHRPHLSKEE